MFDESTFQQTTKITTRKKNKTRFSFTKSTGSKRRQLTMFSKRRSSQRPPTPPSINNSSSNLTKDRSTNLQRSDSGNESFRRRLWNFVRPARNRPSSVRFTTTCSTNKTQQENFVRDEIFDASEHVVQIVSSSPSPQPQPQLQPQNPTTMTTNDDETQPTEICVLCCQDFPLDQFERLTFCSHSYCRTCLKSYLKLEISEGRVTLNCPQSECPERIHPCDISRILVQHPDLISKYEQFMVRRVLQSIGDTRWCPAPDCGFAVIASGHASCPEIPCLRPGCNTSFCYHCKSIWHPNKTCEDAAREKPSGKFRSASLAGLSSSQTRDEIKQCPRCQASILKMDDGSCNHMTCPICEAEFCWLCGREISDLHYLSPSGCTFWGKKQWSRKKVILWQVATLIGAPVIIALIAGVAVPAVIIGVPIWTGRKIFKKFNKPTHRKEKRNLLVALGVLGSVIVSPIIAALAVGIGVPILLAYVYGVIPISLCRTGGCGLGTRGETSENEGPTIDNFLPFPLRDVPIARAFLNTADTQSVLTHPTIGGDSTSLSNSIVHLVDDRIHDNLKVNPQSTVGSISESLAPSHRLDVQVEVSDQKNFDIESITISEKSSKTMDSLKALAGSIKDACIVPGVDNPSNEPTSNSQTDFYGRKSSLLSSTSDSHQSDKTVSFYDERQRVKTQFSTDRY